MLELLTILQAMQKARHRLALYVQDGERDAEAAVNELLGILDNEELDCALQKVETNVASPPIAPDVSVKKSSILTRTR